MRRRLQANGSPVTGAATGSETAAALAAAVRVGESVGDSLVLVTYDRQMHRGAGRLVMATYPEGVDAFYAGRCGQVEKAAHRATA